MLFSDYCKAFYQDKDVIADITNQNEFVIHIFKACGVCDNEIPKPDTAHAYFSGTRGLPLKRKKVLLTNSKQSIFISHFKGRIKQDNLNRIGKAFALEGQIEEKPLLLSLYYQLYRILSDEDSSISQIQADYLRELDNERKAATKDQESVEINDLWVFDAELAEEEQSEFKNFTYTQDCRDFLKKNTAIWGIVSAKGVGKTYLLQKKRRDLSGFTIPQVHKLSKQNGWGIESIRLDNSMSLKNVGIDELVGLWKASIICYVIKHIGNGGSIKEQGSLSWDRLPSHFKSILEYRADEEKLSDIFNEILLDENWRNGIGSSYTRLKSICKRILSSIGGDEPIMLFIDKIDQAIIQPGAEEPDCTVCFKRNAILECEYSKLEQKERDAHCNDCAKECCMRCPLFLSPAAGSELRIFGAKYGQRYESIGQWQYLQLSIIKAVSDIKQDFNSRIHVYYAIRQEALSQEYNILGANLPKLGEHTRVLHYSRDEQEMIFNNTIKIQPPELLYNKEYVDKQQYSEGFVGIHELCHPYVDGVKESLFDSIYRHSFDRAREIQIIGKELSKKVPMLKKISDIKQREEEVKKTIEVAAADLIFSTHGTTLENITTYFADKQLLQVNYWADPQNFRSFIQEIDRNLLFMDDMASICKKINHNKDCNQICEDRKCWLHPFTMLYQMGLLGIASYNANIEQDCEQNFLDSKDITYYNGETRIYPNNNTIFIIHPALTKCIELRIRKTPILHFKGFILGKGLRIPRECHFKLLNDKKNMRKEEFESLYYSLRTSL